MIRDEMNTRVYYVSMGGFDTHAGQFGRHASLMTQFGQALNAFYKNLKAQGDSGRVLTMVFSEFGRRVRQNASAGTDHGTAGPVFVIGGRVKGGFYGEQPSLTDLIGGGDLKHNVDFRSIYATLLNGCLGLDAKKVLKGSFATLPILG